MAAAASTVSLRSPSVTITTSSLSARTRSAASSGEMRMRRLSGKWNLSKSNLPFGCDRVFEKNFVSCEAECTEFNLFWAI